MNVTSQVSCYAGANGSATVSMSGGTSPYSYQWSNGSSSQSVSGLSAGNYTVTVTDVNGDFKIQNVPVSRISLQISCVGYETLTIPNLEVTSGKELVVNIEMTERVIQLDEVKIKAWVNKEKPPRPAAF